METPRAVWAMRSHKVLPNSQAKPPPWQLKPLMSGSVPSGQAITAPSQSHPCCSQKLIKSPLLQIKQPQP